ncbi:MAG: hypothetical protein ACKVVP_06985 [Chloroflexota bacterium]
MDDQTPEMDRITAEMRELMRRWIENPNDKFLKQRYSDLQLRYQELFIAYRKRSDRVA